MRRRAVLAGLGLLPLVGAGAQTELAPLAAQFIDEMVARHGFSRAELEAVFAELAVNDRVIELITPASAGGRRIWWDEYRGRHVTLRNIAAGKLFMRTHGDYLQHAAEQYGVPARIIAAIIGIETRYGTYTGGYTTVETLATLGLAYPPRAAYFRRELEQLFLYARAAGVAVTELEGSYAGAMGYPQFMPSSARQWAVDFDADGTVDLFTFADAIGSVGNFLAGHGWERGKPVAFSITPAADAQPDTLLAAGIRPTLQAADFAAAGLPVDFGAAGPYPHPLALVDLENETVNEYRAGTINYYVLTRYNRSNKYAMAVLDLADAIEDPA